MTFNNFVYTLISGLNIHYLFFSIIILFRFVLKHGIKKKTQFPIILQPTSYLAIIILLITLILTINFPFKTQLYLNNLFIFDSIVQLVQTITITTTILIFIISNFYVKTEKYNSFEFVFLILIALIGINLFVSAYDLMALYLALELQSMCFYILAAYKRRNIYSLEAGLKYFILGSFSSSILLFGISLIYGLVGATNLEDLYILFSNTHLYFNFTLHNTAMDLLLIGSFIGIFFILIGLLFKIYSAPMHLWIADVYQGAPTHVTAFFAIVPAITFFTVIIRLLDCFYIYHNIWLVLLFFTAVLSMFLGLFGALYQKKIKRLFAYSTVGHVGYFLSLIYISINQNVVGIQYLYFYLIVYIITSIGLFTIFLNLYNNKRTHAFFIEQLNHLSGLYKLNPMIASIIAIFMFSLSGIPPLLGFISKLFLFTATLNGFSKVSLFFCILLSAVISCFYYIRMIKIIYFNNPNKNISITPIPYSSAIIISWATVFLITLFLFPEYITSYLYNVSLLFI